MPGISLIYIYCFLYLYYVYLYYLCHFRPDMSSLVGNFDNQQRKAILTFDPIPLTQVLGYFAVTTPEPAAFVEVAMAVLKKLAVMPVNV